MKNLLLALSLALTTTMTFAVQANRQPTNDEIKQNRKCFQDLKDQGCRSMEENPDEFKACLSNAHATLEEHCQKTMLELYGS